MRIRLESDGQEGWADAKMICPMKPKEYASHRKALKTAATVAMPMAYAVSENNGQTIPLTAGTKLTGYGLRVTGDGGAQIGRFEYLWGGKNVMGIDCSGFTQVVMSLFGKKLPRNASEQATCGRKVASLAKVKAGDLVFFDHEDGKISHVGIAIDAARVIHCSGRVKVEKLDETGIFNAEAGTYSHHLVTIRRI